MRYFLIAAFLAAAMPAKAFDGTLIETTVPSTNVPSPVAITYYLPKDYDAKRAEPYPLLIQLHGAGLSNKAMMGDSMVGGGRGGLLDQAIENGLVAPMVSVMPSAGLSEYMNFKEDGSQKWEDFIMKDLLTYMRKNFNVSQGRQGTFITGTSMGGEGSLRIAVKHPEVFQAVASQEPAIYPTPAYDVRDKWFPDDIKQIRKQIYGDPIDNEYWAANNPATIIKRDPSRLLGLGIYLEVGDQDMFHLDQGTEFVHRVLFDAGISHEYRLVKGADHTGASLAPRILDAFTFIGRQINPPNWIDDTVLRLRAVLDNWKRERGYPVTPFDQNRIHAE